MRNEVNVGRFAVLVAVGLLTAWPALSQGKDPRTPEQRAADAEIARRICAPAEEAYRAAEREYNEAWLLLREFPTDSIQRSRVDDLYEKLVKAIADYCECLRSTYAKAKLPMPPDYERLCVRPPAIAPPPGGATVDEKCAAARDEYLEARERWIEAGRPFLGMEAAAMGMEIERAARAYCDCLKVKYGGRLPSELAKFCDHFGPSARRSGEPPKTGPGALDPPLPPAETPAGVGGPIRRSRPGWGGISPPKGAGNTGSPSDPPPIPVPPPPPGAGGGSGAGVPGGGTPGPTPTPAPATVPPPPPPPTEVGASQIVVPGMRANLSFSGIVHPAGPDPHANGGGVPWCRQVVATQLLTIPEVTATSFSIRLAVLPGNLVCGHLPNGPVDCVGTFSGLFGSAGETTVRATGMTFTSGRVLGTLLVQPRDGPFSASFSGELLRP